MESQGYDVLIKAVEAAPLPSLLAIAVWFLIFRFWPWYQVKEEGRIKADLEYRDSWLRQAAAHTEEIRTFREEMNMRMNEMRYDLDAVLMVLAKDRPELIEFFKHRDESRKKSQGA